jgi:tRNA-2-methylthio-N6-dimethylallyladenosine synthase
MHRPPDHIVDECKRLADAGVIEVTLLGQTVNHYRFEHGSSVTIGGVEQPQKGRVYAAGHRRDPFRGERTTTFADLIARIHDEVPAIKRLRFVTSYPRDFGDDVLEVMLDRPRICRYLHVPAQTGSDRMLAAMNRGYSLAEYLEFIDRARSFLDEPAAGRPLMIAGDIIAGFCGETEEDHQATIALLERVRYKNCFIFKYSPRPGTAAFDRLPDDVPEAVKRQRVNELLEVQARNSEEIAQAQSSRVVDVFVQGLSVKQQKAQRVQAGAAAHHGSRTQSLTISAKHGPGAAIPGPAHEAVASAAQAAPLGDIQLTGRTEGDLIVVFDSPPDISPESLIGRIVPVRVQSASRLTLAGVLEAGERQGVVPAGNPA